MVENTPTRMYICIREGVPDHMVPVLVAHTMINAHIKFSSSDDQYVFERYHSWFNKSFKKCVVSVGGMSWERVKELPHVFLGYENTVFDGSDSCAVCLPLFQEDTVPNVLKFSKLWRPNQ